MCTTPRGMSLATRVVADAKECQNSSKIKLRLAALDIRRVRAGLSFGRATETLPYRPHESCPPDTKMNYLGFVPRNIQTAANVYSL